jgi:hypothetical protein
MITIARTKTSEAPRHSATGDGLPDRQLRRAVAGEVSLGAQARAAYASDSSNYRQPPLGVSMRALGPHPDP